MLRSSIDGNIVGDKARLAILLLRGDDAWHDRAGLGGRRRRAIERGGEATADADDQRRLIMIGFFLDIAEAAAGRIRPRELVIVVERGAHGLALIRADIGEDVLAERVG